jgi:hypothetical protein
MVGVEVERADDLAPLGQTPVYARVRQPGPLRGAGVRVAREAAELEAWLGQPIPAEIELEVHLNQRTAPWLLAQRARVAEELERLRIHQPSHEHLSGAARDDVRDPRAFFAALDLPVRVSGLPPCLAPGALWIEERAILDAALFDAASGRLDIRALARHHVSARYRAKSVRCADCRVNERCDGAHINMVRDQGLAILSPLVAGAEAEAAAARLAALMPAPPPRLADGCRAQPVAESLPGFAPPGAAPPDPLAVIGRERQHRPRRSLPVAR